MAPSLDQITVSTAVSLLLSVGVGFMLRDVSGNKKEILKQTETLQAEKDLLMTDKESLAMRLKSVEEQSILVKERETSVTKKEQELLERENSLRSKEEELRKREQDLEEKEADFADRDKILKAKESAARAESMAPSQVNDETPAVTKSESEQRIENIKEELRKIITQAEKEELEDDFEPEAIEALEKAAFDIAHRKKYYDVMKDELIYFPTIKNLIINYDLMEEAEKYYFDEEDEFPMEYSVALRSTVTLSLGDGDDDIDEEYMSKLAIDVEL